MNKMADTLSLCILLHQCISTLMELFDRFLQDIIQQNHAGGRPWSNGSGDSQWGQRPSTETTQDTLGRQRG